MMTLPQMTGAEFEGALAHTCAQVVEMLRLCRVAFLRTDADPLERVKLLAGDVHRREEHLTQHAIIQLREAPCSLGAAEQLKFAPAALERVGDAVEALAICAWRRVREELVLSEAALHEIRTLFDGVTDLVETVGAAVTTRNHVLIRHLREDGARIQGQTHSYETAHQERLMSGVCPPRSSSLFLAMLDSFREIERYTRRLADSLSKPAPRA